MTLEEKIGQLNQLDPTYDTEAKEALIRAGQVGSLLNAVGAEEANRLQRMAVEETRLGIPLIMARDVIHGFRTIYPIPLGQGATWNPALVEASAALTADEAVSAGIRWAFSPMVDVAHDPRWGRSRRLRRGPVPDFADGLSRRQRLPESQDGGVREAFRRILRWKADATTTRPGYRRCNCAISTCRLSTPR